MDRPVCLIDQSAGLGDILFIQKIVDRCIADGYHVVFPIVHEYRWVGEYIQKEHLTFIPIDKDDRHTRKYLENIDKTMYLPLYRCAECYPHMNVMASKYQMLRMNYYNWQDHLNFKRFYEREQKLVERLGVYGKKYNLICNTLITPPKLQKIDIQVNNGLENIYTFVSDEFTSFDWAAVIAVQRMSLRST